MRYYCHMLWLLLRPIVRPFFWLRRRSRERRQAEVVRVQREMEAALEELAIELMLAQEQPGDQERS